MDNNSTILQLSTTPKSQIDKMENIEKEEMKDPEVLKLTLPPEIVKISVNPEPIKPKLSVSKTTLKIDHLVEIGEEVYLQIKKLVDGGMKPNAVNLMAIVIKTMEVLDKVADITGSEKKTLVLRVITRLVDEFIDNEAEKIVIKETINTVIPASIDAVIDGIKGKIDVKRLKKKCGKCLPCL